MRLEIFNVEHGACALITTSNGKHVMIDSGHNASTKWYPGNAMLGRGVSSLDRLFVTNYDEDHVSGLPNLLASVHVRLLTRNWKVQPATIRHLKSEDGMGYGIERLVDAIEHVFTGGPPAPSSLDYGDTSFEIFANPYGTPPYGFDDENNLSLVVFVSCGAHRIVFPGDLEKAGWRALLQDPHFVTNLKGVTVFVASHHGRENGYCPEVFEHCADVKAIIISDSKVAYQSQETLDLYRQHTPGFNYNGVNRRVLTTRSDGGMVFEFGPNGATVTLERGG